MRTPISALPSARRPIIFVETPGGVEPVLTDEQRAALSSFPHVIPLSWSSFTSQVSTSPETFALLLSDLLENVAVVGVAPGAWATVAAFIPQHNFQACYVAGYWYSAKPFVGTVMLYFPTSQILNQAVAAAVNYEGAPESWDPSALQDLGTFGGVYSLIGRNSGLLSQAYTSP